MSNQLPPNATLPDRLLVTRVHLAPLGRSQTPLRAQRQVNSALGVMEIHS